MDILLTIGVFLVMVSVLVFAHELGHYLVARAFHMDVEEFAIGFGKKLARLGLVKPRPAPGDEAPAATEFTLRALPLGGFVRIKGMHPQEDGSEVYVKNGFYAKSPAARFLVLLAGPVFSVAFGVLALVLLYTTSGQPKADNSPVIGAIAQEGAAYKAGLRIGDRILSIAGRQTPTFFDFVKGVRSNPGVPIQVVYRRGGAEKTALMTPMRDTQPTPVLTDQLEVGTEKRIQGKSGAMWRVKKQRLALGPALAGALTQPLDIGRNMLGLITRPASAKEEIGGPIVIGQVTHQATKDGLATVIWLAAMLSMSLGFMNLLPIPPLDGGQMLVALVEGLRGGRRLSMKVQQAVVTVGLVLVGALVLSIFVNDVTRLFGR